VEAVAEHPREQAEVLADVTGDPEQRKPALVGAEGDLERVRVERERGAGAARDLHPCGRPQSQPRRPAPRLHRRRPTHLARRGEHRSNVRDVCRRRAGRWPVGLELWELVSFAWSWGLLFWVGAVCPKSGEIECTQTATRISKA
jgi:hypothetical protein